MKPMWCFYGGKWRSVPKYPEPLYDTIVEPFAGAAGYATRFPHLNVLLYDLDPVIAGLWDYLIHAKRSEIMRLPVSVACVDNLRCCDEAKHLIGFWLNKGSVAPCHVPSSWMRAGTRPTSFWGEAIRHRIAEQVQLIRHWRVSCAGYESAPQVRATWFIDPPYKLAGKPYKKSSASIDYKKLGGWCKKRHGQVMVCENSSADWLPFEELGSFRSGCGSRGYGYSNEALYYRNGGK